MNPDGRRRNMTRATSICSSAANVSVRSSLASWSLGALARNGSQPLALDPASGGCAMSPRQSADRMLKWSPRMIIPTGNSYIATVVGQELREVKCENCDCEYVYIVRVQATGRGFSP